MMNVGSITKSELFEFEELFDPSHVVININDSSAKNGISIKGVGEGIIGAWDCLVVIGLAGNNRLLSRMAGTT